MKVTKTQFRILGIPIYEKRSSAESDLSNPAPWMYEAFGGFPTSTGITITPENSLQFSAVYACVRVIADQMASFPKGIYRRVDDRTREKVHDHPLQRIIDSEPSEFYSAFDFWDAVTTSVMLWGNGFAKMNRNKSYEIESLEFIPPNKVTIYSGPVDGKFVLFYKHNETGNIIPARDMLHFKGLSFDGVQGKSVIQAFAKESIGLSVAAERFGSKFFGNDTLMTKYLSHPAALTEEALTRLKTSWQTSNAGLENAFKIKILEEGMKLENVGIPPEQAQFIATRQHQVEEICRWFKVQPHLIQHLLRSTNNNIEHQGIEFVTQTLTPWVVRFEYELNRKIFTEEEKGTHYLKMNMASLLRGDIKARTDHYVKMISVGVYSPNEIRELEDRNPREGGDEYTTLNVPDEKQDETTQEDENKNSIRSTSGITR